MYSVWHINMFYTYAYMDIMFTSCLFHTTSHIFICPFDHFSACMHLNFFNKMDLLFIYHLSAIYYASYVLDVAIWKAGLRSGFDFLQMRIANRWIRKWQSRPFNVFVSIYKVCLLFNYLEGKKVKRKGIRGLFINAWNDLKLLCSVNHRINYQVLR